MFQLRAAFQDFPNWGDMLPKLGDFGPHPLFPGVPKSDVDLHKYGALCHTKSSTKTYKIQIYELRKNFFKSFSKSISKVSWTKWTY